MNHRTEALAALADAGRERDPQIVGELLAIAQVHATLAVAVELATTDRRPVDPHPLRLPAE